MYRILTVYSKKDNCQSLYQLMTTEGTDSDGNVITVPLELADKSELDAKVESMLNDEGYAKADFMVVQYIDYNIDAKEYSDD